MIEKRERKLKCLILMTVLSAELPLLKTAANGRTPPFMSTVTHSSKLILCP